MQSPLVQTIPQNEPPRNELDRLVSTYEVPVKVRGEGYVKRHMLGYAEHESGGKRSRRKRWSSYQECLRPSGSLHGLRTCDPNLRVFMVTKDLQH